MPPCRASDPPPRTRRKKTAAARTRPSRGDRPRRLRGVPYVESSIAGILRSLAAPSAPAALAVLPVGGGAGQTHAREGKGGGRRSPWQSGRRADPPLRLRDPPGLRRGRASRREPPPTPRV